MKQSVWKRGVTYLGAGVLLVLIAFPGEAFPQDTVSANSERSLFAIGELVPENNTGEVWVKFLVPPDSVYTTAVGNETFAAGARTHWHTHPAGEILMVTEGVGYHKIEGEPLQVIRKGDVVRCPPGRRHWHGAKGDSRMSHVFIVPNTEKGIVEWSDAVTDNEYTN